jgi:hypothetical protein
MPFVAGSTYIRHGRAGVEWQRRYVDFICQRETTMSQKSFTFVMAVALPAIAAAQGNRSYECTSAGETRRVEVAYPSGGELPCEVRYLKGGVPQVLWSAEREAGYCETQARDFISKLQGMGWVCSDLGTEAEAAPPDDTDVLEPAGAPPAEQN